MTLVELHTTRLPPDEAVLGHHLSFASSALETKLPVDLPRAIRLGKYIESLFRLEKYYPISSINSAEFPEISNHLNEIHFRMLPYFITMQREPSNSISSIFSTEVNNQPQIHIYPMAIVVRMEGYDYARIADKYCRSPTDPKSLGTTASFNFLPEAPRGRLLLINEGDGAHGVRSEAEIIKTERHELTHALFNTCFSKSPLFTTEDLSNELSTLKDHDEPGCHNELAIKLLNSMGESARSEVIAYFSTGDTNLVLQNVGAHWWNHHFECIEQFIDNKISDHNSAELISEIYLKAEQHFLEKLREYAFIAKELYREASRGVGLSHYEITALLLECPFSEASKLHHLILPSCAQAA